MSTNDTTETEEDIHVITKLDYFIHIHKALVQKANPNKPMWTLSASTSFGSGDHDLAHVLTNLGWEDSIGDLPTFRLLETNNKISRVIMEPKGVEFVMYNEMEVKI